MDDGALCGLFDNCTPLERQLTLQYFEQLKSSPDGWKICATDFTENLHRDDRVKFFCLQVLEHHVRSRHASSSDDDILALRKLLMAWIQLRHQEGAAIEKPFIKNKMAQVFALTFVIDYPIKWPQFFSDLLQCVHSGSVWTVDLFLRILVAIDGEVVDRQVIHTHEHRMEEQNKSELKKAHKHLESGYCVTDVYLTENTRNTLIKDTMRDQCVADLVESWFQIMTTYASVDDVVTCLAMEVVGAYVSWIDINLIANDKFVGVLLKYLSVPPLREGAANCLHEIVSKGMDPLEKTKLVESLCKVLESAGVLSVVPSEEEDVDFEVVLSKLVNGMGCALVTSWNKLMKSADEVNAKLTLAAIEAKLPYLHRYLSDEDDGISEVIVPFAVQYISILKRHSNLSDNDRTNLQTLLGVVITKLKFDKDYNFLNEGEEEALFLEYRKQLKVLFDNIAQLDPPLVLQTAQSLLASVFANLPSEPFMNVEVALRVFYMLGEVITDKKFGAPNVSNSPWHQMMITCSRTPVMQSRPMWESQKWILSHILSASLSLTRYSTELPLRVVQSQVCHHTHVAVVLQYYETLVRYEKFFILETQYIPGVLDSFLGSQGLRHPNSAVRSRLSYLFVRFIKAVKNHLGVMAEQVMKNLQGLLLMVPGSLKNKSYLSCSDLTFLYEAAGILVASSQQPPEGKRALMNALLATPVNTFPVYLAELTKTENPNQQEEIAQALYHLISFASRASKVFTNHQLAEQSGCLECFAEALPVFLHGLEAGTQRELLHSGVRQYLHRMIICLGDELLKYIPMIVLLLLKDSKCRDLQEFISLINQLIAKYKEKISPFLQEVFMPVVQSIATCLNQPFDSADLEEHRERQNLQKSYFLFINSIATNNVTEVIARQESQNLEEVLRTLVQGAEGFPDPAVQKVCFGVLRRLVDAWGAEGTLPGFVDYMYKHIVPACFLAPLKITFDLNDGHSFLALGEIAGVLKAMLDKRGNEVIVYLQNEYLPSLNVPPHMIQVMLQQVQEAEIKTLKPYLKALFAELRTATNIVA